MKIKSLWISEHKNIKDKTFTFNDRLISLLVGLNGLGKSNLLEAIVIIFRDLDLASSDKELTTETSKSFFDYKIEYSCKKNDIRIEAINASFKIEVKLQEEDDYKEITYGSYKKSNIYFPDLIFGYYSGENKRIKQFFAKHSEDRITNLKSAALNKDENILGKMFFTDQNFGELIFLTLWVFKDTEKFGNKIKKLLQDYINIDFNSHIEIKICNPAFKYSDAINSDMLFENIQNDKAFPFWGLKGDIDKLLRIFYNNNSSKSEPITYIDKREDSNKKINEFVVFDKLNFDSLREEFEEVFDSPIKLFDVLQAADDLGIIYNINTIISKNGTSVNHDFSGLSEGEQQLLTVIGLIMLSSEFDSFYILDEPDTHLNPQWQRDYIKLLEEFNFDEKSDQILVATHSPLIVQSSENADVFLFKKENEKTVINYDEHKIHNWRIDQVMQSDYFGIINTRPPSLDEFMKKREELLSKTIFTDKDRSMLRKIEKKEGALPNGETLNDLETLHFLKKIVTKSKKYDKD